MFIIKKIFIINRSKLCGCTCARFI